MKKIFTLMLGVVCAFQTVQAQQPAPAKPAASAKNADSSANDPKNLRKIVTESQVVTQHQVTIKGQRVPYKAVTGTLPVWDENGKAIAGLFYTYYERTDVKNRAARPLIISFNGGPGAASVWMHIGYTGPVLLNMDDEGYPVQPYGYKENNSSILDVADIVYIDPVGTGYSRTVSKDIPTSTFYGVNADIKYLAEWINTFVTRNDRWASPKFLIGESYGTTRVSGLALELQSSQWMYLNGVILVSPTTLGIDRGAALSAALRLPYFAATAWYHKALKPEYQNRKLDALLPEVEKFTMDELIPALAKGSQLSDADKKVIAAKMSAYSGLSEKVILQHNLDVPTDFFWKDLLRDQGFTIGRLDSRYRGLDREDAGDSPDYNAELTSWLHSFTPAMNMYIHNELKYKTDLKYIMLGSVRPWDNSGNRTAENLRAAMAQNPYLNLMVQSGYFDGACDYFNAKYNLWQMDPGGKLKDRISWEGYESGHMMYLRKDDLQKGNDHIRAFINKSLPKPGVAAKF